MSKGEDQSKIDESSEQRARLPALLATGRRLIAEAQQKGQELDQLWAALKDACTKGRQQAEQKRQGGLECQNLVQQKPSSPTAIPPPARDCADSRRLLILVENDPDDLMLFRRALQKAGVTNLVRSARDGAEAMEMLLHPGRRSRAFVWSRTRNSQT